MAWLGSNINASYIESLPKVVLASLPTVSPPPSIQSNFHAPNTLRPVSIGVTSLFISLATISISIRLYNKLLVTRKPTLDDFTCFLGYLMTVATYVATVLGVLKGGTGVIPWDEPLIVTLSNLNLITVYITPMFISLSLGLVKSTLMIQYYLIFWPLRWIRIVAWIIGVCCIVFYVAVTITGFIVTSPWPGESILADVLSKRFMLVLEFAIPIGVFGVFFDLFLLGLPIKAISTLELHRQKKVVLVVLFATGAIALAASIAGLMYRVEIARKKNEDFVEWYAAYVYTFSVIEACGGIMCSSMPAVYGYASQNEQLLHIKQCSSRLVKRLSESFSRAERPEMTMVRTPIAGEAPESPTTLIAGEAPESPTTSIAGEAPESPGNMRKPQRQHWHRPEILRSKSSDVFYEGLLSSRYWA